MKNIKYNLQNYQPTENTDEDSIIEILLRRGVITILKPKQLANEMTCQDCGGRKGHVYLQDGKKGWFCGNTLCLKNDATITRERDRKVRLNNFQLELKRAENQKKKNEWDGK